MGNVHVVVAPDPCPEDAELTVFLAALTILNPWRSAAGSSTRCASGAG